MSSRAASGRPLTLVAVDVVRTPAGDDIGARLLAIERVVEAWLVEHRPDAVAVERVFSQHNVRTVMGTAQASAVAIAAAARRGMPVALHTPSEMKAAVTGSGRADKAQVGAMVTRLLRLDRRPAPADAADALGAGDLPRLARRRPGPASPRHSATATAARSVIAFVSGRVAALAPDGAVVEVGGVGLAVQCTPGTLAALRLGEQAHLPTSLVVREDSLTLYGFADEDERVVFELLQTASGVGPRLAQAMLAVHDPDTLRRAVATEDLAALMQVPGIGRKGAQRIVLELKDRLGAVRGQHDDRPPVRPRCTPAGATSCTAPCSGSAGRVARPTRAWRPLPRTPRRPPPRAMLPTSRALLKVALRSLSRA